MTRFKNVLVATLALVAVANAARAGGEGFEELLQEQSHIEGAKAQLIAEKKELGEFRRVAEETRRDLDDVRVDLEQRVASFNAAAAPVYAEVDRYNSQCVGTLPEDQYNSCMSWRSSLEPELNSVNARRDSLAAEAEAFNSRVDQFNYGESGLTQAEADWAARVNHVDARERSWRLRVAEWRVARIQAIVARCAQPQDLEDQAQCLDQLFDGRSPADICGTYGEDLRALKACLDQYIS